MVRYTSLILLAIAAVATANKQPLHNAASSQGLHTVHEDADVIITTPSESQLRKLPVDDKKNDKKPGDDKKDQEKTPDALQSTEGENGGSALNVGTVALVSVGALGALLF